MRGRLRSGLAGIAVFAVGCYTGVDGAAGDGAESGADASDTAGTGDESGGNQPPPALECDEIGSQALRRVSSEQYAQILADLLPAALATEALAASIFPKTSIEGGFSTYASANTVSTNESIAIEDNAEMIAALFFENIATNAPALVPCLSEGYAPDDIDGCIDGFIDDFGTRAFRRPPTEAEGDIMRGLYDGVAAEDGNEAGLTAVLHYVLQAPALLYVTEHAEGPDDFIALSPSELAARLGLLFLNGAPDAGLLAAVDEGRLQSQEDVEREARRLVEQPEAKRAFAQFHHEWMAGFKLDDAEREHELWTDASSAALIDELGEFARWFLDETDGTFQTLMTTEGFAPDQRLSPLYAAGGGGPRPGLMATAAAMAAQANPDATSLVARGAFIRNHVMCIAAPAFPGDIDIETPLGGYGELPTARQRLQPLMTESACASCHVGINPLGFAFEVYDWAGAYRTTENGEQIDASAEISLGSLSGTFANAGELLEAIAATDEARDCYATHWFRYTMGRPEAPEDSCSLDTVTEAFAASDGDVRELLVAIAVSDAFRFRKTGEVE